MVSVDVNADGVFVYYEVSGLPDGGTWSFGDEDTDLEYIESTILAWQTWRDFVIREGLGYNAD